ncbi:MAG TPA: glycosyltransferase, partial [Rhodoferax sp.]
GATVDVVCCDAPDDPCLANTGLSTVIPLGPAHLGYGYTPRLLPWLRANAAQYDAVIVNGLWQYTGFAAWRALAGTKTPYFVFTHGMLDPWFKHTYPLKHLKKWLYWPWAEYRVLRDARAVIFTCEDERLLARQSFWLYRANEAVTAYGTSSPPANGSELKNKFLDSNADLRGKRLVLFLSRIQDKKGCDLLIDAFAQVASKDKNLHLVMAGPDQSGWVATLQAQAAKLGIADRISWTGMLQGDMKWGAFYAAEVFCLPSHQENFGIVVAEALACGKPVLISNKVNIWREIESDAAGFVDTDTVDGTVRNLQRWLALDADGYAAVSGRARQCFATRFHIQRAAERLVEIIGERK